MSDLKIFVRAGRDLRQVPARMEPDIVLCGNKTRPGVVLDGTNLPPIPGFDMDFLLECIASAINEGNERQGEFEPDIGLPVKAHWRLVDSTPTRGSPSTPSAPVSLATPLLPNIRRMR